MKLRDTLRADAARQLHFAGRTDAAVGTWAMIRMIPSPRFLPVVLCRLAFWCGTHRLSIVGKALSLTNFVVFGLEIGVTCEIGPGLYFPHTRGTVIGARRIGSNAVIYHQVTIGANAPDASYTPERRPLIGDDVFIGSGAKVLGGITLHDGCVVGANAVVLRSVPAGALVGGVPARVLRHAGEPAAPRAVEPPTACSNP